MPMFGIDRVLVGIEHRAVWVPRRELDQRCHRVVRNNIAGHDRKDDVGRFETLREARGPRIPCDVEGWSPSPICHFRANKGERPIRVGLSLE